MVNNNLVGGWPTPLKNDGLRQLGLWNSQYMESHKTCSSHHQPVYNTFFAGDGGSQSHYFLETVLSQLRSLATLERMTRLCALSCHSCNVSQTGEIPPAQPCDILVSLGHYRSPLPVTTADHLTKLRKMKQCHISVLWVKPNLPNKSC